MLPDYPEMQLPKPDDERVSEAEFYQQVDVAWQVCDRFDLQTDIWRGRILRAVREREKLSADNPDGQGIGFLKWLQEHDITKSQAYSWIEVADSADVLIDQGLLDPEDVKLFSKRAFIATAQAAPEVQQMVTEAARQGEPITRREVKQLTDEWVVMSSEVLPTVVKEKAASSILPTRYVAPLVRELEKLPDVHQSSIQAAIVDSPDVETVKQVTMEARCLAKYLQASQQVQALELTDAEVETALDEALRIGCLNSTAELVNQAAQLEQAIAKLYLTWKRLNGLIDRVYVDSGASTPYLQRLIQCLNSLASNAMEVQMGDTASARTIRLQIQEETHTPIDPPDSFDDPPF